MPWINDLMPLAEWAMRTQDLRHRYLFASKASTVLAAPGIARTLETAIILAIYEAALGKGYVDDRTIGYEKSYPLPKRRVKKIVNPKRSDLAFKDPGKGKNWAYVEVKYYGPNGKYWVGHDIRKLKNIRQRSQRWVLVYRVRSVAGKSVTLENLLLKNFSGRLDIHASGCFSTIVADTFDEGVCELCLAKVL